MRRLTLLLLALASLLCAVRPAIAAEERCNTLGGGCVCSEPLNTATHDGGNAVWPSSIGPFNPDDSTPGTKECVPYPGDGGSEAFCNSPSFGPVTGPSQASFLPQIQSLSFLMRQQGTGVCHVNHPTITQEARDATFCLRQYARWEVGSSMPLNDIDQRQKIMTMSGVWKKDENGNPISCPPDCRFLKVQISFGEPNCNNRVPTPGNTSGTCPDPLGVTLRTAFDDVNFATPLWTSELGQLTDHCQNNFCRFELCLDYRADGKAQARFRRTNVAPGSGSATVTSPVSNGSAAQMDLSNAGPAGLAMFAQDLKGLGFNPIRYASHFIMTKVRPMDQAFWPGPACEIEGGCTGSPPTFVLSVGTNGTGSGSVSGGGTYSSGATAMPTATPNPGSIFAGWSGDCSGTANPCSVVMNADKSATATFTSSGGGGNSLTIGSRETMFSNAQLDAKFITMDGPLVFVRRPTPNDSSFFVYHSSGIQGINGPDCKYSKWIGTPADPFQSVVWGRSDNFPPLNCPDKTFWTNQTSDGVMHTPQGDYQFSGYWLYNIYQVSSTEWLGFIHIENDGAFGAGGMAVALARSTDAGDHWRWLGYIGHNPNNSDSPPGSGTGYAPMACCPYFVINDAGVDYFYVYANEDRTGVVNGKNPISVMRAPVASVIADARNNTVNVTPGVGWTKYRNGSWSGNALTQVGDYIVSADPNPACPQGGGSETDGAYNAALNRFLLLVSPLRSGGCVSLHQSSDGINWPTADAMTIEPPPAAPLSNFNAWFMPNSTGDTDDGHIIGNDFYIGFFFKQVNNGNPVDVNYDEMYRRHVTISGGGPPPPPSRPTNLRILP